MNKRKDFRGFLTAFDADTITIEEDEQEIVFNRKEIALVRLAFDF